MAKEITRERSEEIAALTNIEITPETTVDAIDNLCVGLEQAAEELKNTTHYLRLRKKVWSRQQSCDDARKAYFMEVFKGKYPEMRLAVDAAIQAYSIPRYDEAKDWVLHNARKVAHFTQSAFDLASGVQSSLDLTVAYARESKDVKKLTDLLTTTAVRGIYRGTEPLQRMGIAAGRLAVEAPRFSQDMYKR